MKKPVGLALWKWWFFDPVDMVRLIGESCSCYYSFMIACNSSVGLCWKLEDDGYCCCPYLSEFELVKGTIIYFAPFYLTSNIFALFTFRSCLTSGTATT